jgi:hypothetical protein
MRKVNAGTEANPRARSTGGTEPQTQPAGAIRNEAPCGERESGPRVAGDARALQRGAPQGYLYSSPSSLSFSRNL